MTSVPLVYRLLSGITGYALNKKDYSPFSQRSTAAGIEPVRLFVRLEQAFDPDTNDLLGKALDKRRANPMANSIGREDQAATERLGSLLQDNGSVLAQYLKRLFEDEVRDVLNMGQRAVFDADVSLFLTEKTHREALAVIREFCAEVNLPRQSWGRVLDAWAVIRLRPEAGENKDEQAFLDRLRKVDPSDVPPKYQAPVLHILNRDLASTSPAPVRGVD